MKTAELRKVFLEFFKAKGHKLFASDTLVPDDESLLFTSAGMNQFKPYFLGEKKDVKTAVSCQKCLRTGDLENVGKTAYHHTFFEMLGNFSFGGYFKKEAIEFAWEFITEKLKLRQEDLAVSVYKDDPEAYAIWKDQIGIAENKIVKLGEDSNFWPANAPSLGPNGPCGPCSEIFFDRGQGIGCRKKSCNPDCSCGRFVEVWNLVFTQFNRVGKNKLERLIQNNIDTGMGLERMACVLQKRASNFEIDILAPVVKAAQELIHTDNQDQRTMSLIYAIVDHARAATFAIADGVYPSNEDRGYVIRKIIRKALWSANLLGKKEAFLYDLSVSIIKTMDDAYPELIAKREIIAKVIQAEEEKFLLTLEDGQSQFSSVARALKAENKNSVPAEDLFRFYDTYGLPLELTKEMARISNLKIDEKGFNLLLKQQQERSRKKSMFKESIFKTGGLNLDEKSEFLGYRLLAAPANVLRLFVDGHEAESIAKGQQGLIVLDKTVFYPEAGGQLCDKGAIKSAEGEFKVDTVFKINDAVVHKGEVIRGKIAKGRVSAAIDENRRRALARSHTATHLLQAALRSVLGEHVIQQGSLVDEDKFRFDFTHFSKMSNQELAAVEEKVKQLISEAKKVNKQELNLAEAKSQGALAFFKDKYQDKVRMVSISDYSKELCGGTHVANTKDIGNFAIISESSISSGIRRIRAVVGVQADSQPPRPAHSQIKAVSKKVLEENKKASQIKISQAVSEQERRIDFEKVNKINRVNFLFDYDKIDSISRQEESLVMLGLSDRLKQKLGSGFVFIVRRVEEKDIFICSATDDLVEKGLSCRRFISEFKKVLSLSGGGSDRSAKGVIIDRGDNFSEKVKGAFSKFTNL